MAEQTQPLCVYQGESAALTVQVYDEAGVAQDLTGLRLLLAVYNASNTLFTKDSNVSGEITFDADQVANPGLATVAILPADLATAGLYTYALWLDDGADQDLVVPPSRFDILPASRG